MINVYFSIWFVSKNTIITNLSQKNLCCVGGGGFLIFKKRIFCLFHNKSSRKIKGISLSKKFKKIVCVGVEFLSFNFLLHAKAAPKVIIFEIG